MLVDLALTDPPTVSNDSDKIKKSSTLLQSTWQGKDTVYRESASTAAIM